LAAKARGASTIRGLSNGEDVAHTLEAVSAFGAEVRPEGDTAVRVQGGALHEPTHPIDVGNSGTGIRLLAGWAAGIDGLTILAGDESIARRPMDRVVEPLRLMGAVVEGREGGRFPPLVVRGGSLRGIEYRLPVPSAQVKGAVLLAGVDADGETTVVEDVSTRAHTEELLALCGANISVRPGSVTVRRSALSPLDIDVPGDPSHAAFWVVAACITPGSELTVENVYTGVGRAGFVDVLLRMGADLQLVDADPKTSTATIRARYSLLKATTVHGNEVPSLIDEIPALAVAAAYAEGETVFADAAELKVKESDRIATTVAALSSIGATAEARHDGLVVVGSAGEPLAGGAVDAHSDHRIAMSLAVAAAAAGGPVVVEGWESVATSYPGFAEEYQRCAS
ncbi:MAG TPA: 3-phosphoshikimate 1-carboxyvinyltransferase, partial [Acidimicrobiales bacterium]|nr:3-phosphoshikimate 1-carboxyvinyltransferase [Acidimicrobiales bacterium]